MTLPAGKRIGSYEVIGALGAGGMGEVYRARDVKLNREVALKILPDAFAGDPDRLARFHREAQLLATLNHPHIAAIYGFEETDSVRALVLELVDGPTLTDRLAQGPLPLDEALGIAHQIAAALEAAHERGIVHRDLKPANVKIAPDGAVKVLDFGLAKMLDSPAANASDPSRVLSMSPTLSVHATYAGVILGTAAYMSPEQARGRAVDKRADVWAFGCVLFEMLSGARPFDGDDVAETIGAVIHKDPAWDRLPASTPAAVRTTLERCLQKDPKQRIRDIGDAQLALGGAFETSGRPTNVAAVAPRPSRERFASAIRVAAALAIGAAGAWTWTLLRSAAPNPHPVRFTLATPTAQEFYVQGYFRNLAISDDGRHIVYVAGTDSQLTLRSLDQLDASPFQGITGVGFPFLSPDGRWVGYFSITGAGAELRKVSITGGPSIVLCRYEGTPRGATWSRDDTIVFATNDPNTGLLSVPAGGGDPKVLTKPDRSHGELDHVFPAILPDGRHVLYTVSVSAGGGPEASQIAVFDLQTTETRILIRGGTDGQYVDSGHLVYAAAGSLRAVRFAADRLAVLGDPVPILDHVATMQTGAADYGISRAGTLVYVSGGSAPTVTRTPIWVTREGREEPLPLPPRSYTIPRLSPDETQIAFDIRDQQNDIWIWNVARQTLTPLTFDAAVDGYPVWTIDGRRILFGSNRGGPPNVYAQAADGTGTAERLVQSMNPQNPMSLSPDGTRLVVTEVAGRTGADLMLLHLDTRKVEPLLQTAFAETGAEISPDGRWLAYYSNESGSAEVYVRPFPNVNEGRWLVSKGGGTRPAWSKDGKELFYLSPSAAMMAVPIQTSPTFSAGNATKLFDGSWYAIIGGRTYDVSRDGKRFLMIKVGGAAGEKGAPPTINVVLNWTDELKARLPASH